MQKQAPSIGRILVAVGFALSCFGLMLFLWITFGGPRPFAPEAYRFTAQFTEAITLQKEADVRIGGVSVGKVKQLELPEDGNDIRAVIELEPEYAPISSDARAILRQKTLLGETYVELTTGAQTNGDSGDGGPSDGETTTTAQSSAVDVDAIIGEDVVEPVPEGGGLADTQTQEQVQIDEIFNALDEETRTAFQLWMKNAAIGIQGRGLDFNDAIGNLGPFASDASDILETLQRQDEALSGLVSNTGEVFEAITARDQQLAGAITGSNKTFGALASRDDELAEVFQILPTFERESRFTLERLEEFSQNAEPLADDLVPVARDARPTLRSVRRLAKPLKRLFRKLGPLIDASCGPVAACNNPDVGGLPALRTTLDGLAPVMVSLDPFLANLNPVIRYLNAQRATVADFLAGPPAGTSRLQPGNFVPAGAPGHVLRQISYINASPTQGAESVFFAQSRGSANRGNGYLGPESGTGTQQVPAEGFKPIGNQRSTQHNEIFPSWDCANTINPFPAGPANMPAPGSDPVTGERAAVLKPPDQSAACTRAKNFPSFSVGFAGNTKFPQLFPDDVPQGVQVTNNEARAVTGRAKGAGEFKGDGGGAIDVARKAQPNPGVQVPFSGIGARIKKLPDQLTGGEQPPKAAPIPAADEDGVPIWILLLLFLAAVGGLFFFILARNRDTGE